MHGDTKGTDMVNTPNLDELDTNSADAIIPAALLDDPRTNPTELVVYALLLRHQSNGTCAPWMSRIAREARSPLTPVQRALQSLARRGHLSIERMTGTTTNVYTLHTLPNQTLRADSAQ